MRNEGEVNLSTNRNVSAGNYYATIFFYTEYRVFPGNFHKIIVK